MNKKQFGCILALLVVLLCGSVMCNFVLLALSGSHALEHAKLLTGQAPRFDEATVEEGTGPGKIAQISLRGIITSSASGNLGETMVDDLKIQLHQAATDDDVKAIVLYVDSPGGEVTAADEIYDAVCRARQAKPVVVYMGSLAASGGYYVSCGGSYLIANDTSLTGSIGVIIETLNYESLFGKIGLDMVVFKSGQFKDMLSGARPMTDAEKVYVQNLVMQTYGKFFGIVRRERKIPEDQLRPIADGRVISGRDALTYKLVDNLGQIEDAYEKARELGGVPHAPVVRYEAEFRLGKILRLFTGQSQSSKVQIEMPGDITPHLEAGRIYLLPSFFVP